MFRDAMFSSREQGAEHELVRALRSAVTEAARCRRPRSSQLRARVTDLVDELKAAGLPPGAAFFRVRSIVVRTPEYQLYPAIADGLAGWCLEQYFSGPTPQQRGSAVAMKCLAKYTVPAVAHKESFAAPAPPG